MAGPLLGRAVSARLLRLEGRLARAERRLRLALALRGRVRALERRLEPPRGAPRRGDGAEGARRRRDCGRKDGEGSGAAAESGEREEIAAPRCGSGGRRGGSAAARHEEPLCVRSELWEMWPRDAGGPRSGRGAARGSAGLRVSFGYGS